VPAEEALELFITATTGTDELLFLTPEEATEALLLKATDSAEPLRTGVATTELLTEAEPMLPGRMRVLDAPRDGLDSAREPAHGGIEALDTIRDWLGVGLLAIL